MIAEKNCLVYFNIADASLHSPASCNSQGAGLFYESDHLRVSDVQGGGAVAEQWSGCGTRNVAARRETPA